MTVLNTGRCEFEYKSLECKDLFITMFTMSLFTCLLFRVFCNVHRVLNTVPIIIYSYLGHY